MKNKMFNKKPHLFMDEAKNLIAMAISKLFHNTLQIQKLQVL